MSKWRDPKKIDLIVIHCSATPNGRWVTAEMIDEWHQARGFHRAPGFMARQESRLKAIGYHFVIYTNGAIANGRHLEETGAHVKGLNEHSIGVCMIGTDKFSLAQWDMLQANIMGLQKRFPKARVAGHRDLSPDRDGDGQVEPWEWLKTCPGFDVSAWITNGMQPLEDHILEDGHAT